MEDHKDAGAVDVVTRARQHAKLLVEGGAPHQQELAQTLSTLAQRHDALVIAEQNAQDQLRTMRQNIDKVLDERDLVKKAAADQKREHEREIDALRQDHAEALRNAQVEREAIEQKHAKLEADHAELIEEHAKLGIASTKGETAADLKAKSKK